MIRMKTGRVRGCNRWGGGDMGGGGTKKKRRQCMPAVCSISVCDPEGF